MMLTPHLAQGKNIKGFSCHYFHYNYCDFCTFYYQLPIIKAIHHLNMCVSVRGGCSGNKCVIVLI